MTVVEEYYVTIKCQKVVVIVFELFIFKITIIQKVLFSGRLGLGMRLIISI